MKVKDFLPLIKEDNAEGIKEKIKEKDFDVNSQDNIGYTLLMYAVSYHCPKTIKVLLSLEANPFLTNESGRSAFSIALRENNEDLAAQFLKLKEEELTKAELSLSKYLDSEEEGGIFYFIASNIGQKSSTLKELLGFDSDAAQICFVEAVRDYEALGKDSSELLKGNGLELE